MEEIIIRIENAALKLGKFSIKPAIINIPKAISWAYREITEQVNQQCFVCFLGCMIKCREIFT